MIFHDFIIIEKIKSTSLLSTNTDNVGIIKEIGDGYYSDNGEFIHNITTTDDLQSLIGKRILFSQHMEFDIDGEKVIVVRGRDVIKVWI